MQHGLTVKNDSTYWHLEAGWCWNILVDDEAVGTLAVSISAGCICFMHLHVLPDYRYSPVRFYRGFAAAVNMLLKRAAVVVITVPVTAVGLRKMAVRLGFVHIFPGVYTEPEGLQMAALAVNWEIFKGHK